MIQVNSFVPNLTEFFKNFDVETIISELQREFPELGIDEKMKVSVSQDHQCFVELLEKFSCSNIPNQSIPKVVTELNNALMNFKMPLQSGAVEPDEKVIEQLVALQAICAKLSNPHADLQSCLLELSWGCASLPAKKKFSPEWSKIISESSWILLEDIARQVAGQLVSPFHPNELFNELSTVFSSLVENEKDKKCSANPASFSEIEKAFCPGLDAFILKQASRYITILNNSTRNQNPNEWLKQDSNIKALFRCIEVVGEAPKILSTEKKQQIPSLLVGGEKNLLWKKLRNELHHNKRRCWDTVRYAPELWIDIITFWLPRLEQDILSPSSNQKVSDQEKNLNLKKLCDLCEQIQFVNLRRFCSQIHKQFKQTPVGLFRYLLGIDVEAARDYESIWNKHVEPFLNEETVEKNSIIQALEAAGNIFILESDIKCLAPPGLTTSLSKEAAIQELKMLLKSVQPSNTKEEHQKIEASFVQLASQFVFLRMDGKTVVHNALALGELKKLISDQRKQLSTFSLDKNSFEELYGDAFKGHITLKRNGIEESIQRLKKNLNTLLEEWKIDFAHPQTKNIKLKTDISNTWSALKRELKFTNMKDNEQQLENWLENVKDVPIYQLNHKKITEEEFTNIKTACVCACTSFLQALETADYGQIENMFTDRKERLIELRKQPTKDTKNEVGEIFKSLGCIDNKNLAKQLGCEINSKGLDNLKQRFNEWLNPPAVEAELLKLTALAEDQLSISYVQTALLENKLPLDRKENHWVSLDTHITLLRDIYYSGPHRKDAWGKIENANKAKGSPIVLPQNILPSFSKKKDPLKYLKTKIDQLGTLISAILESEKKNEQDKTEFMLLGAEYDMQEINDLAQAKSSKSPILSSQHVLKINLIRRLTAHYPLSIDPSVMRWNLEFLAFDTKHHLSSSLPESVDMLPSKPISRQLLGDKIFDILDYLDLLHLNTDIHVLYPWVDSSPYTPFGAFTILVRPSSSIQSKIEFLYHVMECELLLSHELDAHVKVIGEWDKNELLNIPAEQYVPEKMIKELVKNKLSIGDWIHGHAAYDLFKNQPWSKIISQSRVEVTYLQYEMYRELAFFFNVLVDCSDFSSEAFQDLFTKPDLEKSICSSITKLQASDQKAMSRWVSCLFERFAPPGVTPDYPIDIPAAIGEGPLRTVIDKQGHGLKLMSSYYDHEIVELDEKELLPYYQKYEEYQNFTGDFEEQTDLRLDIGYLTPPYAELQFEYLSKYAASVLEAHKTFTFSFLKKEYSLDPQLFRDVATVIIDDAILGEQSTPIEDIPSPIKLLIDEEAQKLSGAILKLVQDFEKNYGQFICRSMLQLLEYDKIIHQQVVDYYHANRIRLRGPYIRMDQNSRIAFEQISGSFPFVRNFRDFLSRIYQAERSLKLLIPENAIRNPILKNAQIRQSFLQIIPDDDAYKKCEALFRIITKPKLFKILQGRNRNQTEIIAAITEDLLDQFKHPILGEESMAKTGENAILLYHPRSYFPAKQEDARLKQDSDKLIGQTAYIVEWESLFHEPFKLTYHRNPIIEVREMIDCLFTKNTLPNYEFALMPTYTDYWNFVNEHPFVEMTTISRTSGLQKSFKMWVLKEGWDFERILQDGERKLLLEQNKRSYTLIETYIPFLELENELSNIAARLITHSERLNALSQRKENLKPTEGWEQNLLHARINQAERGIELARKEIHKMKIKILETDFFKIFQLFANYQYFTEQGDWKNPSELPDHTFLILLPDKAVNLLTDNKSFTF